MSPAGWPDVSVLSPRLIPALTLFLPLLSVPASAQPQFHAMFQDHAVLQRGQPVEVWGTAAPGAALVVRFDSGEVPARADDAGRWRVTLPAHAPGGPYALSVTDAGGAGQTVQDILVGDVWFCSGQSNMVQQVNRALDSESEQRNATDRDIRMLTVQNDTALSPQSQFLRPVRWQPTAPETVGDFSAACYFTARELKKTLNIPMGLVVAAWSGSKIQAWTAEDVLAARKDNVETLEVLRLARTDAGAALKAWARVWENWWRSRNSGAAEPWRQSGGDSWRNVPALTAWENWGVPALSAYNGMVWYRTRLMLSAEQARRPATLHLGQIDDVDQVWINGRMVGTGSGAGDLRHYTVPAGVLRAGDNDVVVNVLDAYGAGGMTGPADAVRLELQGAAPIPLTDWRYRLDASGEKQPPRAPWEPTAGLSILHNAMVAPIGPYTLKGALWYQGESDTGEPQLYAHRLGALAGQWRRQFGNATLPVFVAQLANYGAPPSRPAESGWADLRAAQAQAVARDPHMGLAVAIDIGDRYDIHPTNKQELGRRFARAIRHVVFGAPEPPSGPVAVAARRIDATTVEVRFSDVTGALTAYSNARPIGFELCGRDAGACRYVDARIATADTVLLSIGAGSADRVRFCWADSPVCTLFDGAHLPAGPFERLVTP